MLTQEKLQQSYGEEWLKSKLYNFTVAIMNIDPFIHWTTFKNFKITSITCFVCLFAVFRFFRHGQVSIFTIFQVSILLLSFASRFEIIQIQRQSLVMSNVCTFQLYCFHFCSLQKNVVHAVAVKGHPEFDMCTTKNIVCGIWKKCMLFLHEICVTCHFELTYQPQRLK